MKQIIQKDEFYVKKNITENEINIFIDKATELIANGCCIFRCLGSRNKNRETLLELGLTNTLMFEEIRSLEVKHYSKGPEHDRNEKIKGEVWIFGKEIAGKEIYIKLKIDKAGSQLLVISFHTADYKIYYPYK